MSDVLTDENHRELFDHAAGRTEDQVRELVVQLCPKAAPMDVIQRVRTQADVLACDQSQVGFRRELGVAHAVSEEVGSRREPEAERSSTDDHGPRRQVEVAHAARALQAAKVEPLSSELRRMHVTVSREFMADLDKVKALLSHVVPGGNLEAILHACIKKTIEVCEKRRRGSETPRPRKVTKPTKGRTIPAEVRREVWMRDQGKCTFVGSDGTRCGETHFVQFHHIVPFEQGGPSTVSNLTLMCFLCRARHKAHMMVTWVRGLFIGIRGEIEFDALRPEEASVDVQFPSRALWTGEDARDAHLRSAADLDCIEASVEVGGACHAEALGVVGDAATRAPGSTSGRTASSPSRGRTTTARGRSRGR